MTAPGAGAPSPFPWDDVLHLAFARLGWTPDTVWRATPREIAAALGPPRSSGSPLALAELAALMDAFPDGAPGSGSGPIEQR